MKRVKQIGCIVLSLAMMAGVLTGCKDASDPNAMILKIGDREFEGLEYSYYFNANKSNYDNGDSNYWDGHEDEVDTLKKVVLTNLMELATVDELAKENGVSLTDAEKKEISEDIENVASSYASREEYEKKLQLLHMTPDILQKLNEDYMLQNKLLVKLYGDSVLNSMDESKFLHAKHVLIKFADSKAENHEAELKKAAEVVEKARAGEDFDQLIAEYNEDPGMTSNPDGYYFREGEMVDEFYQGTLNLKENEISEPIATQYGYHVILRLPVEEGYIQKYVMENIRDLLTEEQVKAFSDMVVAKSDELDIKYGDVYNKIKLTTYDDIIK